jgi:hypothetical protein
MVRFDRYGDAWTVSINLAPAERRKAIVSVCTAASSPLRRRPSEPIGRQANIEDFRKRAAGPFWRRPAAEALHHRVGGAAGF